MRRRGRRQPSAAADPPPSSAWRSSRRPAAGRRLCRMSPGGIWGLPKTGQHDTASPGCSRRPSSRRARWSSSARWRRHPTAAPAPSWQAWCRPAPPRWCCSRRTGSACASERRAAEVEQRILDWRTLAAHAGIAGDRVLDLDLDHLTADSRRRLTQPAGRRDVRRPRPRATSVQRFDLIVEHAAGWRGEPDTAARGELHRAIARLWEADGTGGSWRSLLQIRTLDLAAPGARPEERRGADGGAAAGASAPRSALARRRGRRRGARLRRRCRLCCPRRHRLAARLGRAGCRPFSAAAQAERARRKTRPPLPHPIWARPSTPRPCSPCCWNCRGGTRQ